ncbi:hypothetical protein G6F62_015535 [Rhizopus arrhizus]|nr:hypothetical protein G6F62_015535 [Rhizopus arrhizus]
MGEHPRHARQHLCLRQRRRLARHAGTPRTGTSAVLRRARHRQHACARRCAGRAGTGLSRGALSHRPGRHRDSAAGVSADRRPGSGDRCRV